VEENKPREVMNILAVRGLLSKVRQISYYSDGV
jgi:hypothetical protein